MVAWCFASARIFCRGSQRWTRSACANALSPPCTASLFGLVFLLSGCRQSQPARGFAVFAAWADFATGVLAMLALLTMRMAPAVLAVRRSPSIS